MGFPLILTFSLGEKERRATAWVVRGGRFRAQRWEGGAGGLEKDTLSMAEGRSKRGLGGMMGFPLILTFSLGEKEQQLNLLVSREPFEPLTVCKPPATVAPQRRS